MEHQTDKNLYLPNRLGFHFYPDADHYSQKHLNLWLPILQQMKLGWLVLYSPLTHAIPEDFIRPLVDAGIKVIVDFQHPLSQDPDWPAIEILLTAYGKWGVSYALLDRNANMRDSWGNSRWGDPDLINTYAQLFLKFANIALDNSIHPVLGPLVPGGDYWDTAFLKILLAKIADSATAAIRNNLTLSTYGWTYNRSLDWGTGGPAAWPAANPYQNPDEASQNHQGFRAYEWVHAAAHAVFSRSLSLMLFEAGISSRIGAYDFETPELSDQMSIVGLINGRNVYSRENPNRLLSSLPSYIKSANFFVLSSNNPDHESLRWFQEDGLRLQPAQAFYVREGLLDLVSTDENLEPITHQDETPEFKYHRYFLISQDLLHSTAGILESLQPLIEKDKPMVGFSTEEACQAAAITYITTDSETDPDLMGILKSRGSLISVIHPQEIPSLIRENDYETV
jgi:hypothetical protein